MTPKDIKLILYGSKTIEILLIIGFWTLKDPSEVKMLIIDTVSQNKLNTIKILKFDVNFEKSSPNVGSL